MTSEIRSLEKYTRLADYISAAQIFLRDNVLLEEKLKPEHIKKRLLGHWGTSPGINFVYAHVNRLIKRNEERDFMYIVGPGHGFPAFQAGIFLDKSLSAVYPEKIPYSKDGLEEIIKNFSTPYGYPSHLNPEAPGVVLEGGELGYSLATAYGTVLDNPDLVTVCLVGDGEAETGPLAAAWNANRFINPGSDGAVLPVLHLNGYKISGPTIFGRMTDEEITKFFESHGYSPMFIDYELGNLHEQGIKVFDKALTRIAILQDIVRNNLGEQESPRWPVIILRTPKGMGCPAEVDGKKVEGNHLSHQVVFDDLHNSKEQMAQLNEWLKSYKIEELVDFKDAELILDDDIMKIMPEGARAFGRARYAHQGAQELLVPDVDKFLHFFKKRGEKTTDSMREAGKYLREVFVKNKENKSLRLFSPDETYSNHLDDVFKETARVWQWPRESWDKDLERDGRVVEILSEHTLFGMLVGYILTGRYGYFATYEAFAQIVASMADQYVKFIKIARKTDFRKPVPAMNVILSSLIERQDHNGFSHQNPSFISSTLDRDIEITNTYFPADKNMMLLTMEHTLKSTNSLNVIVCGKKMLRTWLSPEEAREHMSSGVSEWKFLSDEQADVVLATVGDYVTEEAIAGLKLFREFAPEVGVRFVNFHYLDILAEARTDKVSKSMLEHTLGKEMPIVFNYHGYVGTIEKLAFGVIKSNRIIINGYRENGSTTSPFDMEARNGLSRYHVVKYLTLSALKVGALEQYDADAIIETMDKRLAQEKEYIIKNKVDPEDMHNWDL